MDLPKGQPSVHGPQLSILYPLKLGCHSPATKRCAHAVAAV